MIGMARGFVTTLGHLVRPAITERYPDVKRELPERSRMSFAMLADEDGSSACKACLVCERDCPDHSITVVADKPAEGGKRVLRRFTIDLGTCMYCGLCVESCPSGALVHTGEFEHAPRHRDETILVLYDSPPGAPGPAPERASEEPAEEEGAE